MKQKSNSRSLFPQAFVVCFGPLLACSSASAAVALNENNATNIWTLPSGTNLLTGAIASGALGNQYGSSSSWSTLTNGSVGPTPDDTTPYQSQMGTVIVPTTNDSVTFALDLTGHPNGYNITALDSYGLWNNAGRDDQNYTFSVSTDNINFTNIAVAGYRSPADSKATHTRLTDDTGTGVLASNVKSIRIQFTAPQENGGAGYSEFVLTDAPLPVITLNEANTTNVWTLPAGTNLLDAAAVPSSPPPSISPTFGVPVSGSWTTMTDGALGAPNSTTSCVAVSNGTEVIFPMKDLVTNTKGYDLTALDFYCAWTDSGRNNQNFTVSYSTYLDPETFIPLETVNNQDSGNPNNSTHTRLTPSSGFLASNVAAIKLNFANQENGWVGYREFVASGTASPINPPLTWTGSSGSGGNATWTTGTADNWTAFYDTLAPLNFTPTGANRSISVPSALTASSMTFSHTDSTPYAFTGSKITVSNSITSTGAGPATYAGVVKAGTGVVLSGSGRLAFNSDLESAGLILSGTGSITLNADNYDAAIPLDPPFTTPYLFSGTAAVSNGTLNVANDLALQAATLSMTGGTANFTTATPSIAVLSGTAGTVTLGNTELTVGLDLPSGHDAIFAGNIAQASGTGGLTKAGESILTLSGLNTYTGTTHVTGGTLQLAQKQSLASGSLVVDDGATLGFNVGSAGEFDDTDLNALSLGGFAGGSTLGINTTGIRTANFTLTRSIAGDINLYKKGESILTLTGTNSGTGDTRMGAGTIVAAGSGHVTLPGDVYMGEGANLSVFMCMGADNQFGPNSVLHLDNPSFNGSQSKFQLRGTHQTIAGLESPVTSYISIIQNDDATVPDYVENPGLAAASLTIDTPENSFHSFRGIIRDQVGPPVSIIKNGLGTQEFINLLNIQGYGYSGPTTVNAGTLRINFAGPNSTGFQSNITINSPGGIPATLNFHAENGNYAFNRLISGAGKVVVDGQNAIILTNGGNLWTGGTTVIDGFLALSSGTAVGAGTAEGQSCVGGAMDPSNVIKLTGTEFGTGSTLSLDNTAALGDSTMLPEFALSIHVDAASRIFGGTNTVAFVPNITLDGGKIEITSGATTGGFNTNLCLVGTVIVGGSSGVSAEIFTSGTGANANVSLGSIGAPGTTFQVADVAEGDDLTVSSILRDVATIASPLIKTGPGTMLLSGANTYTGDTTVSGGELTVSGNSIADSNKLILAGTGKLGLAADETVGTLFFDGDEQDPGTYGAIGSDTDFPNARFTGTGILTVGGVATVGYETWALVITNGLDERSEDADSDGFSNLDEFLFGTSPVDSTATLSTVENTGSTLIIRWCERLDSTSVYELQESTTLVNPWDVSEVTPTDDDDQDGLYSGSYVRKQAVIPVDSVRKFARVFATE
ncbi:MAG: autotransporter-associated beta strand repeat-containing protein [Verrucomicrobiota bacterium]